MCIYIYIYVYIYIFTSYFQVSEFSILFLDVINDIPRQSFRPFCRETPTPSLCHWHLHPSIPEITKSSRIGEIYSWLIVINGD